MAPGQLALGRPALPSHIPIVSSSAAHGCGSRLGAACSGLPCPPESARLGSACRLSLLWIYPPRSSVCQPVIAFESAACTHKAPPPACGHHSDAVAMSHIRLRSQSAPRLGVRVWVPRRGLGAGLPPRVTLGLGSQSVPRLGLGLAFQPPSQWICTAAGGRLRCDPFGPP